MNSEQFKEFAKASVDYIVDYMDNIRDRQVLPDVEPGFLRNMIPEEAPVTPEKWQDVLQDIEKVIMPGVTHWQSPNFHAYYPAAQSYPSIVADMFSAAIATVGFSWITGPACTELEGVTLDWLGKMIKLPEEFLNSSSGPGGGVIQGSASESTLVALLAAKEKCVRDIKKQHPEWDEGYIKSKLVSYASNQSNSSVEKAGMLGSMPMRLLEVDDNLSLRGSTLAEAIKKDRQDGLIPCYVVGTLGTTGTCAFDSLEELGKVCKEEHLWLHVDAAYAGAAFVCPEYRYLMKGVELADSFNFNAHKWMLVNFDCSLMWVKDSSLLIDAFNVDRIYLKHNHQGVAPDYRHWQIPLGRRFRSLKLWFVLRLYGVKGIQEHIRGQIKLAKDFEDLVFRHPSFEVVTGACMGLVCFRLKGDNSLTERLLKRLTARKLLYMVAATIRSQFVIRFAVNSRLTEYRDIKFAWDEIKSQAEIVLRTEDDSDIIQPTNIVVSCKFSARVNVHDDSDTDIVIPKKTRKQEILTNGSTPHE